MSKSRTPAIRSTGHQAINRRSPPMLARADIPPGPAQSTEPQTSSLLANELQALHGALDALGMQIVAHIAQLEPVMLSAAAVPESAATVQTRPELSAVGDSVRHARERVESLGAQLAALGFRLVV